MGRSLYLGLEISTQQVKVIAIDDSLNIIFQDGIKFDTDLPEFHTSGGVHSHSDQVTFTAPAIMWVKAVDYALDRMKKAQFDFASVVAISGTAQQHGSVYWRKGAQQTLKNLDSTKSLADQLTNSFSVEESPIWMDASTEEQCRSVEKKLGGAVNLSRITGCRAYHRITGNQIAKIFHNDRAAYENTERISLVSSFGASLLIGDYAPIDESDGSGMNLMDLKTRQWSHECLEAYGVENLSCKLGGIVASSACVGTVSPYLVKRFGFSPDCKVIAFTGDNPASLAGMRVQQGDIIVSLGTSDTLMLWLTQPKASVEGLVLVNPLDTNHYMGLLCFKNGSLTREKIRNNVVGSDWQKFSSMLKSTPRGNGGNVGIYFDVPEITPDAVGIFRFNAQDEVVDSFSPDVEVRALIEAQFLSRRMHSENLGYTVVPGGRVLATGGASNNKDILQVLADVFNAPVYVQNVPDSACLGSAYRAKHGYLGGAVTFQDVVAKAPVDLVCAATPSDDAQQVYDSLVLRYRKLEHQVVQRQQRQKNVPS